MRPLILAIFLLSAISLQAEDWKTIDGKIYLQIKVIKVEADAVTIFYRDGGARIPLIMLPEDLQKKFNYQPALAKAAADARDEADFENARALRAEQQQLEARKLLVLNAEKAAAESTKTTGIVISAPVDHSHHAISDLVDPYQSLSGNGASDNHYSINGLVNRSSHSAPSADDNHYSRDGIYGSGDPLNP
jgi:hypothetical protein